MHSDSDSSPIKRRKAKTSILDSTSSSDESDILVRKRKHRQRVSSSSSDSDGSFIFTHSHKKPRVLSDCDSDSSSGSSDSEVEEVFQKVVGKKKPLILESDSDSSEGDKRRKKFNNGESGSQSSDEESERCIICFKIFRGPVAHPSGCLHNFHSECLLTWSKTSNTCPIDRVKYTEVIVVGPEGGIISRHKVSTPPPLDHNDIEPDDPTFCEVCHQHDREHEMLLCDRCEAGYHMNCLNPPLFEVPLGNWFCPHCSRSAIDEMIDEDEVNDLLREGGFMESRLRYRAPSAPTRRVGPRSRAAQRVIASIREMAEQAERYQPSSSTSRSTSRRNSRRTKSNHRTSTRSYKVELITVEDGSTIEVKVAVNTKVRRKKKSCARGKKRKSKGRSASSGFVNSRGQDNSIVHPLDIMGSRPQLEYFSGCEAEDELEEDGGLSVLRARNSVSTVRGMTNRKQIAAQVMSLPHRRSTPRIAVSSAPPDLLSSILDEQTKWHSPNAVIHSNSNGEVRVVLPNKNSSSTPVKKAAGNGDALGSGSGTKTSSTPSSETGARSEPTGEGPSSSSIPPLQPPPQPVFSRVYEDEDFDLYADIEPPRLAPPPEPPALLLALEGDEAASSPEDTMLVIDDRQTYDPDVPTSPPPSPPEKESAENEAENPIVKPLLSATNQDTLDLSSIRLPSPDPEIDDCPNRVFYSETSINIAKEKQDSDGEMEMPSPSGLINKSNAEVNIETVTMSSNKKNVEANDECEEKCDDGTEIFGEVKSSEKPSTANCKINNKALESENINAEASDMIYDPEISEDGEDCSKYEESKKIEKEMKENSIANIDEEKISFDEKMNQEFTPVEKFKVGDFEEKVFEQIEEIKLEDRQTEKKNKNMQIIENKQEKIKLENLEGSDGNMKLEEGELNAEEGELKDDDNDLICSDELEDNKPEIQDSHSSPGTPPNDIQIPKENNDKKEDDESDTNDTSPGMESESNIDGKPNDHDTSNESTPPRKVNSEKVADQEGEDVLELGCGEDERDGLVDITDEEISTYEKSWELEDNAPNDKTAGLEGLETEAISEGEDNMAEDGQVRTVTENGPKEEGEIISDEKRVPVAWKKVTKAKERSYREKESVKEKNKKKDKKPKEKRKELERYDVRKIISDKPKKRKVDEFGRDISPSRSRSLSDSRSKSRSRSIRSRSVRSRRSRTRSRSRSRRRRSRERRSRNRSRGRSRARSRIRSRDRSKRRARSKSRSRSDSRRRKSRSPRKKERRSRAKSREKKRRKRDSSISCSSCSCSSCERERRKSKKLTVTVPNEPVRKDKKKSKYKDRDLKRRRVDSPVPSKEVFTSGDNILVSVNFKSSKSGEIGRKEPSKKKKDDESKKKKDKSSKENQPLRSIVSKSSNQQSRKNRVNVKNLKPVAIIDLAQSPFREQTLSPKEVIVLTDSDSDEKRKPDENNLASCQVTGPKTPPEPHIKFNIISSKPQMLRSLTNPLLDSVDQLEGEGEEEEDERVEIPHKGPNTPPEPPVPYDPFEPTKSRSPTPIQELEESHNPPTPPGDKILPPEPPQRPTSPPKPPPEPPKTPSPLHSPPPKPPEDNPPEKTHISPPNICNDDSMDMGGGDSPYSPGSSDGEDIFEPPLPQIATPVPLSKSKSRPGAKLLPKLTPSPLKRKPGPNKSTTPLKNNKAAKKDIGLKLDEDQLKILDDLPNSAVEMQVKDKFLKKLNRQERVVEEVKMVLKPHYAKKHVNKEEYKEILRKSVPKICHSRSGEINPLKIQRLIEAYVKKYRHLRKKRKMGGAANFSAPDSILLLKPKPKATMWC